MPLRTQWRPSSSDSLAIFSRSDHMATTQGTREYRRLPTATDISTADSAPTEQITVKLHAARRYETLEMPHLSTLCGTIAMLVARFITAPACADPVKFDDISDDNDALSDALLVTPDRVTPLSGAKHVCHHARSAAGDNPGRQGHAEFLGANTFHLERRRTGRRAYQRHQACR